MKERVYDVTKDPNFCQQISCCAKVSLTYAQGEEILSALREGRKVTATIEVARWAPDGYEWQGDELVFTLSGMRARVRSTPADVYVDCSTNGYRSHCAAPVEVFRAFEKAGLL